MSAGHKHAPPEGDAVNLKIFLFSDVADLAAGENTGISVRVQLKDLVARIREVITEDEVPDEIPKLGDGTYQSFKIISAEARAKLTKAQEKKRLVSDVMALLPDGTSAVYLLVAGDGGCSDEVPNGHR